MTSSSLTWHKAPRGVTLESPFWRLDYDLPLGLFDLAAPRFPRFHIRWARSRAVYRRGRHLHASGTDDGRPRSWRVEQVQDSHGPGLRLAVESGDSRRPTLEFAATLYREWEFLILELGIHNTLPYPVIVEELRPLEIDPEWGGQLTLRSPIAGLYRAGWQSWSPAGWKPLDARDVCTSLGPLLASMHDAPALRPLPPGSFRSDMVGVLTPTGAGPALLAGLLTTANQFGALRTRFDRAHPHLTLACAADGWTLAPGERLASERVVLALAEPDQDLLGIYGEALGQEMAGLVAADAPRGWCSWPAFGAKVSEENILQQLDWLRRQRDTLPIEVVQLDDGWEVAVGDWKPNERFPHGMKWLAERIREAGFRPGLWLAPFIVHPKSRTARDHPDWILRDARGRPLSAGYSSVGFSQGLDLTHPAVESHVRELIATATQEWGYSYLKLDFLYGAALPGRHHRPNATRAQALRRGLEVVREAAGPETLLLGCGCPLGPAIGLVDTMRVEPDIAPDWRPRNGVITPLLRDDPSFPAAVNTLRNILTRAWTHRRLWLNDPDPLILRQSGSRLTPAEVRTLATAIAFSGGTWMLGDDLPNLEEAGRALADIGLPPHRGRAVVLDVLEQEMPKQVVLLQEAPWGKGWAVALFNWEDKEANLALDLTALGLAPDARCHLHEFWTGEYRQVQSVAVFLQVEPHGCRAFLLRPIETGPQWVGSTLHVIQGPEVAGWQVNKDGLRLTLDAGRALGGDVLLWWPGFLPRVSAAPDGTEAHLAEIEGGIWQLHVRTGPAPWTIELR